MIGPRLAMYLVAIWKNYARTAEAGWGMVSAVSANSNSCSGRHVSSAHETGLLNPRRQDMIHGVQGVIHQQNVHAVRYLAPIHSV